MLEFLRGVPGTRLTREDYHKDVDVRFDKAPAHDSWKLERRQHFVEPYSASWSAFVRGDWDEALRLAEARRDLLVEQGREDARRGIRTLRVRVVDLPITPYLQWELHSFQHRVAAGELIRIVGSDALAAQEDTGAVPELINIGTETLYETLYDDDGLAAGAVRYEGSDVVTAYVAFLENLFAQGVDFPDFFAREVAPLPPPAAQRTRLPD